VKLEERLDKAVECPCGLFDVRYLREATPEDEERQQLFVAEMPT
jgi:hypothetical protein